MDPLDLLTPPQVADILHMAPRSLEALRRRGDGPAFVKTAQGRSGRILYSRLALREWIQGRTRQSTTE